MDSGIFSGDLCWTILGVSQFFMGGSEGGGAFSAIVKCSYFCFGYR